MDVIPSTVLLLNQKILSLESGNPNNELNISIRLNREEMKSLLKEMYQFYINKHRISSSITVEDPTLKRVDMMAWLYEYSNVSEAKKIINDRVEGGQDAGGWKQVNDWVKAKYHYTFRDTTYELVIDRS